MDFLFNFLLGALCGMVASSFIMMGVATPFNEHDIERGWISYGDSAYSIEEIQMPGGKP